MSMIFRQFLLLAGMLLLAGCATTHLPLTSLVPGKELTTIQSAVTISVKTAEKSTGARGYLIYKRPDRFHLVLLSPFGATLLDIYSDGERITGLLPERKIAYRGVIAELPDREGLRFWGLMKWVLARPPVVGPALGAREIVREDGSVERVFFYANGQVQRKVAENGDEAAYADYRSIDGIAFPETIELRTMRGDSVTITFDEPEINKPVDELVLLPQLDGFALLPFTAFPGF
jgi:outer membrane lipoprotein-sorting protein